MLSFSEACERNKRPILSVLADVLRFSRSVLEIGSGTGQHAVFFAGRLGHLVWRPSDLSVNLPALEERFAAEGPDNLRNPVVLDVRNHPWLPGTETSSSDAVFTANTLHIMSWSDVEQFFVGVGEILSVDGLLSIYGPFRYAGQFTSDSNAAFDRQLRTRDPESGIRDFEAVNRLALAQGLSLVDDYAMPANNQLLVFRRDGKHL